MSTSTNTNIERPVPAEDRDGQNVVAFLAGLISGHLSHVNDEGYLKITALADPIEAADATSYRVPIRLASGRLLTVTAELVGWADQDQNQDTDA